MRKLLLILGCILVQTGCKNDHNSSSYTVDDNSYYSNSSNSNSEVYYSDDEMEDDKVFEDGTYTATVDYYNSQTGYNATYTLDVEVEDNEVTVIYFNNGGYLDDDHIWPEELDEDGYAEIEGEDGKYYEVQIDY